jgi:N-acetylglucosaminyldiphosphoundecaprenol N-acetyl-beta-D-mannosaminyltransferase
MLHKIFGINFLNGPYELAMRLLLDGAFMVVPSGPGLAVINDEYYYRKAVQGADFAIADSGLMVLLCRILGINRLTKLSGLTFLKHFLADHRLKGKKIMLINPDEEQAKINKAYITNLSTNPVLECYTAPLYPSGAIHDPKLLKQVEKFRPDFILINIGGGVQERVGFYIKKNTNLNASVICTGAAIAFLTGAQATIPDWADRMYLGWLIRCLDSPKTFVPRYLKALALIPMMLHYRLFIFPEPQE